jgi:hypothetical protein
MKYLTYILPIFLVVLLVSTGITISLNSNLKKEMANMEAKHSIDISKERIKTAEMYLLSMSAQKDSLVNKHNAEISVLNGNIAKLKKEGKGDKQRADSAEARYEREKTIEKCDAVIEAKNELISTQVEIIDSLEVQSSNYEDLALLFQSKAEIKDSLYRSYKREYELCYEKVNSITVHKKTFWDKNKFAIGLIAGVGITYAITR